MVSTGKGLSMDTEWRCASCVTIGTFREGAPREACMCCGGFLWVEAGSIADRRIMDCQGESVDYALIPSDTPRRLPVDYAKALEQMLLQNVGLMGVIDELRAKCSAERQARLKAESERDMLARRLKAQPTAAASPATPIVAALATHDRQRGFKVIP